MAPGRAAGSVCFDLIAQALPNKVSALCDSRLAHPATAIILSRHTYEVRRIVFGKRRSDRGRNTGALLPRKRGLDELGTKRRVHGGTIAR